MTKNFTEHNLNTLGKTAHSVVLADSSRARIRADLSAYADLHTAVISSPARVTSFFFSFRRMSFRSMYAGVAALLIVLVGGGAAAFAAEDTLPGDALYAMKININEPLEGALIPDTQGKAQWHALLAERRIDEAATLLSADKLDPATEASLKVAFASQIAESDSATNDLVAAGKLETAAAVRSDLEARLSAQETVLSLVAMGTASSTDAGVATSTPGTDLLRFVAMRARDARDARIALEATRPTVATTDSVHATLALATKAARSVADTDGSNDTPVAPRMARAKASIESAQQALESNDTQDASIQANAATRQTEEASILLSHKKLFAAIFAKQASTTAATSTEQKEPSIEGEASSSVP